MAFALEAAATATGPVAIPDAAGRRRWRATLALLAVALLGLGAIGAILLHALRRPAPPPSYTQLTFRRGAVLSARFAPDGQTVVYSAAWDGQPAQVYTTRIGSRESRPLDLEGNVLSVSSQGEVAVKRGRFLGQFSAGKGEWGTLARVSLAGGAPRDLLDDVMAADWDPEGRELAVLHAGRLEYPIGHVVYAPEGRLYSVRALPGGRFAIVEDQPGLVEGAPWRMVISLIDRAGHRTEVSPGWSQWWDLSWSAAAQELFFVAIGQDDQALRSVSLAGRQRLVTRLPVDLAVLDVDPEGRLLLERHVRRSSVVALLPGESQERDLSWLDTSGVQDLSDDGRLLVLVADGRSPGTQVLYLRKTDGSPAVRIGDGYGLSLSPDGRYVLSFPGDQSIRDHLILVPTGAGEERELRHPSIREFAFGGAWFPKGGASPSWAPRRVKRGRGSSSGTSRQVRRPDPCHPKAKWRGLAGPSSRRMAARWRPRPLRVGSCCTPSTGAKLAGSEAAPQATGPYAGAPTGGGSTWPGQRVASKRGPGVDRSHRRGHREPAAVEGADAA